MRVPPPQPCASRCSRSCARHGSGSCSACDTAVMRVWKMKLCTSLPVRRRARAPGAGRRSCRAPSSGSTSISSTRRGRTRAAVLPGQVERRAAAGHAAADGGRQVEPAAVRARAPARRRRRRLQLPREAAHQRLDVQQVLARGQVAEVGGAQRLSRGWRRRAGVRSSRSSCAALRSPAVPCALAAAAAARARGVARSAAAASGWPAGTRHRTVRRSAAIRRSGRTAGPAGSSAAAAARARRRAARSAALAPRRRRPPRSRWRAGSPGKPTSRAASRVVRRRSLRSSCVQHAAASRATDLAREGGAVVARLDQRAQRVA